MESRISNIVTNALNFYTYYISVGEFGDNIGLFHQLFVIHRGDRSERNCVQRFLTTRVTERCEGYESRYVLLLPL